MLLLIFQWALQKQEFAKKSSKMAKMICRMGGGLWVRAIEEPTFLQIMWGLWVTAKTISKYMVIGWQQSVLKIGGLWAFIGLRQPYTHVTSIIGVPLHPGAYMNLSKFVNVTGRHHQESSSWQKLWNRMRMHVKIKLEISGQCRRFSDHCMPFGLSYSADQLI